MSFTEYSTVGEIYATAQGAALLEQYLPKLLRSPSFQMTRFMSFRTVCRFRKWKLKRVVYARAKRDLEQLNIN